MDEFIFTIIDIPAELKTRQMVRVFCYSCAIEIRRNNEVFGKGVT